MNKKIHSSQLLKIKTLNDNIALKKQKSKYRNLTWNEKKRSHFKKFKKTKNIRSYK